jgi:DnaJ-class molecular chaperone
MSAEVDEITPIAHGGDPLDRHNVQLAHRICNRCKGTGQHTGQCPLCQATGATQKATATTTFITTRQW